MRIGQDHHFLSFTVSPLEGGYSAFRVEAVASASGSRFTATHDRLLINQDEALIQQFTDFELLKTAQLEIPLSESGWLRFKRDSRGYITVQYRISGWRAAAAMEGEVLVEGEFTNGFCREFRGLFGVSHEQ